MFLEHVSCANSHVTKLSIHSKYGGGGRGAKELQTLYIRVVSFAAVFRVVMQRLGGGRLRDDPKTGCGGD